MTLDQDFWKDKSLAELSPEEWETLCDGCGKCCLVKFVDSADEHVHFTNVVCRYMDQQTCQCTDYFNRHKNVPDCVFLTPKIAREANWLPKSCAYRLLANEQDLPWWHPLRTGDSKSVKLSGASICGKVVSETEVDPDDMEDMVVEWFD